MNSRVGTFFGAIGGMLSFRVVLALVVSTSVTSSVTVPLAYQAHKARDEQVAAPTTVPPTIPETVVTSTAPAPTAPGETTTTTTSTTTTPAPAEQTTTTASQEPISSDGLFASNWADHTDPIPLEGAKVGRSVWVFFDAPDVVSVRFWLNDPDGAGPPTRSAETPFDLAPDSFDFRTLAPGEHTLRAEVTTLTGSYVRVATFTVIEER